MVLVAAHTRAGGPSQSLKSNGTHLSLPHYPVLYRIFTVDNTLLPVARTVVITIEVPATEFPREPQKGANSYTAWLVQRSQKPKDTHRRIIDTGSEPRETP